MTTISMFRVAIHCHSLCCMYSSQILTSHVFWPNCKKTKNFELSLNIKPQTQIPTPLLALFSDWTDRFYPIGFNLACNWFGTSVRIFEITVWIWLSHILWIIKNVKIYFQDNPYMTPESSPDNYNLKHSPASEAQATFSPGLNPPGPNSPNFGNQSTPGSSLPTNQRPGGPTTEIGLQRPEFGLQPNF